MEYPSHFGIVYNYITPGNLLAGHDKVGMECPSHSGKLISALHLEDILVRHDKYIVWEVPPTMAIYPLNTYGYIWLHKEHTQDTVLYKISSL